MVSKKVTIPNETARINAITKINKRFERNEKQFKDKMLSFLLKQGFENASFDCKRQESLMFYLDRQKRFNFFGIMVSGKKIVFHWPFDDDPVGGGPAGWPQEIKLWKSFRQFEKGFKKVFKNYTTK